MTNDRTGYQPPAVTPVSGFNPPGTYVNRDVSPHNTTSYNAYSQLNPDDASYYYNAEQSSMAHGQGPWSADQYKLAQVQHLSEQNRDKNLQSIDQWSQSRNPYYAGLYSQLNTAGDAQTQQAYADSLKKMQLQHAARGTLGGSQSEYNKSQLNAQLATQQAQTRQASQDYVQGIRQNDQGAAQSLRAQQYQTDPYVQAYYQSLIGSQQAAGNQAGGYADLYLQGIQNSQQAQNNQSQIYGGQLGGAAGTLSNYIGGNY